MLASGLSGLDLGQKRISPCAPLSSMSEWGQFQKSERATVRSASPPTPDIVGKISHVGKVPIGDITSIQSIISPGASGCKLGERSRSITFATGSFGNTSKISR